MGARTSKIAPKISSSGPTPLRRYPIRNPQPHPENPSSQTTTSGPEGSSISTGVGPTVHPQAQAQYTKTEAIRNDAADPDFASMLKTIGVVQIPDAARNYDLAHVKNPQLRTLDRRQHLKDQQESEIDNPETRYKRSWADVLLIREALELRDNKKWEDTKIEKELRLAPGFMKRLGSQVKEPGHVKAEPQVDMVA
ncbi:hypothetical protein BZA77DRAFT_70173 [Pyronema omphalodes]|nr:hypothetical protein BZA77DRAFT_70173 [Pyronema omphalodes]